MWIYFGRFMIYHQCSNYQVECVYKVNCFLSLYLFNKHHPAVIDFVLWNITFTLYNHLAGKNIGYNFYHQFFMLIYNTKICNVFHIKIKWYYTRGLKKWNKKKPAECTALSFNLTWPRVLLLMNFYWDVCHLKLRSVLEF